MMGRSDKMLYRSRVESFGSRWGLRLETGRVHVNVSRLARGCNGTSVEFIKSSREFQGP